MPGVSIREQEAEAERPEAQRRRSERLRGQSEARLREYGIEPSDEYINPDTGVLRYGSRAELQQAALTNAQNRQRQTLLDELDAIRKGSSALRSRAEETITLGRRGINEQERLRLQQTESGLANLNLSDSLLGERVRRQERETTAMQSADLESRVRIQEMSQTFEAEQNAIQRLFMSGENELGFFRQARLVGLQAQYAMELEDARSGNAFFGAIGSAVGQIATIGALFAISPELGIAAAAGGGT